MLLSKRDVIVLCSGAGLALLGLIVRTEAAHSRQVDACYAAVQVVDANGRPQVNDPACRGLSDDTVAGLVQRAITHAERNG